VFQDGVCLHFVVTWRTDLRETCRQQTAEEEEEEGNTEEKMVSCYPHE
jgi:hypothetical protein